MYFGLGWSVSALAQDVRFDLDSPMVTQGSAEARSDGYELCPDDVGAVWVAEPFTLPQGGGFRASFVVTLEEAHPFGGGGIVFVIQSAGPGALGAPDAGLGYEGVRPSLAVELDPWQSDGVLDPDDNHVGIDVNGSVDSLVTAAVPFDLEHDEHPVFGWVDLDGERLTVSLSQVDERPDVPLLSQEIAGDPFPGSVWVGFTAAAGEFGASRVLDGFTFVADADSDGDGTLDYQDDASDPAPDLPAVDTGAGASDVSELPPVFFCGCGHVAPANLGALAPLAWFARRSRRRS